MNSGDTAWVLASSALVLLMTPGLALFYGGMTRAKSVLNMLMMSFSAIAVVSVLWVLYGYSMAFSTDVGGIVGNLDLVGLRGLIGEGSLEGTIPTTAFVVFQAMFAIITVALISGAIADRAKFGGWLVFTVLWATIVYFPVAHWVWGGGWIGEQLGAIDFAGGTAVHINSGAAGLALAIVLGRRIGWRKDPMRPHNLPFVLLGAGLLWFGWFGFNAGSAVAADNAASVVFVNTQVATAAAVLGWLLIEKIRDGKPTMLGGASGAIAGLVAITPSCSSVTPATAIVVGLLAGVICALAVGLKTRFGYDDSLDVVAVHLVGGLVGSIIIGLVASATAPQGVDGLFFGGGAGQLGIQVIASLAVLLYSFVATYLIGTLIDKTIGFRASEEDEVSGIDLAEHAETAYDFTSIGSPRAPALTRAVADGADATEATEEAEKKEDVVR